MPSHEQNGHDGGNGAKKEIPPNRAPAKAEKTPGAKLVQFSSGLSRPFIQRPVMTMMLTASIIVFGIITYNQLAVNDLPAVDYPVIRVQASYPGANPITMANTIATPLEKQFTQIPGLELSTSTSSQGNTQITLQFALSKGIDAAATDVQSAIQSAAGQLPNDLPSPPTFTKTNPNDQPVMYVALTSDTLTDAELYRYGTTEVSQRINVLPGVSEVAIYGVKGAIRIKVDPGALATRNLTFEELAAAIRSGTSYSGAGQFDGKNKSITLRPNGQVEDAEGYRNLIIKQGSNGSPVYLRDVAKVIDGVENERLSRHFFARDFNPPASVIVFAVSRQAGANAVEVAQSVRELLPQLQKELPGSIRLIPTFDRSQSIVHSLHDVQATLAIAFVLVIFVIFVFLGRATDTLIPIVALPMSFLITFIAMWALGYSVNNLTLMAMTLAIGFLVDDAIVFLENVVRRAEAGESVYRATLNSAGEISFTILVHDPLPRGGFHSARVHAGIVRPDFSRVRHHHHRRHFCLRPGLVNPDPADVFAHPGRARAGPSQDLDGTLRQPLLRSHSRLLRPLARSLPQRRLARRAHRHCLCDRRLVLFQSPPLHSPADRR